MLPSTRNPAGTLCRTYPELARYPVYWLLDLSHSLTLGSGRSRSDSCRGPRFIRRLPPKEGPSPMLEMLPRWDVTRALRHPLIRPASATLVNLAAMAIVATGWQARADNARERAALDRLAALGQSWSGTPRAGRPVVAIDLSWTAVSDEELAHLRVFRDLERLNLSVNRITDAGLAHLEGLDRLVRLDLGYSEFTDDGPAHLGGLTRLEKLTLDKGFPPSRTRVWLTWNRSRTSACSRSRSRRSPAPASRSCGSWTSSSG